jgi:hypothetical protein
MPLTSNGGGGMIMVDASTRVVQQHKWDALPTETRGSAGEWNAGRTSDFERIGKRKRGREEDG